MFFLTCYIPYLWGKNSFPPGTCLIKFKARSMFNSSFTSCLAGMEYKGIAKYRIVHVLIMFALNQDFSLLPKNVKQTSCFLIQQQ